MSFIRQSRVSSTRPAVGLARTWQAERRSAAAGTLGTGTMACPRCDVPVSPGPTGLSPAEALGCPYCEHVAPVREFLSLRAPARPARVVVRVRLSRP